MTILTRFLAALSLVGLFIAPVAAEEPAATAANVKAAPALWTAHGKHGTVYLFGSIHILPPNVDWHAAPVDAAIKSADVFAFEIPDDSGTMGKVTEMIRSRGTLPPGQSLRAMLSPAAQADFDAVLQETGIQHVLIDGQRPWLADLVLSVTLLKKQTAASGADGVDHRLALQVAAEGKERRYMETADQQLALIVPDDPKLELQSFEADLREMRSQHAMMPGLLEAWERGDTVALDRISNASLNEHPEARKAFFDDRNAAWVITLKSWLDKEDKVFFVTVGAGHLVGQRGVPALLRAEGYKVDGPR